MQMMELNDLQSRSDGPLSAPSLCFAFPRHSRFTRAGSWVGKEGTSGSSVRNQLQSLLSGKCRWIEHSRRVSGRMGKTGDRACGGGDRGHCAEAAIVTELNVRNYRKQRRLGVGPTIGDGKDKPEMYLHLI